MASAAFFERNGKVSVSWKMEEKSGGLSNC